jgi:hypothetical protein
VAGRGGPGLESRWESADSDGEAVRTLRILRIIVRAELPHLTSPLPPPERLLVTHYRASLAERQDGLK